MGGTIWGWDVWVHNASYGKHALAEAIEDGDLSVVSPHRIGASRGSSVHEHHVFPQEFRAMFAKRGIDVDDFVVDVDVATHRAIHGGGNWRLARKEWEGEWNSRILRN